MHEKEFDKTTQCIIGILRLGFVEFNIACSSMWDSSLPAVVPMLVLYEIAIQSCFFFK